MTNITCSKCGWTADYDMIVENNPKIKDVKNPHCPGCGGFLKIEERAFNHRVMMEAN